MPASRARSRRSSSRVFRQTGGCGRHRRRRPSAVRLKRAETRRGNGPRRCRCESSELMRRYTLLIDADDTLWENNVFYEKLIEDFVTELERTPPKILDGVPETLAYLTERHRLILFTKGEPAEQAAKVERSGLQGFFEFIEIVPEKDPETYGGLVHKHKIVKSHGWMIGNSPRSDINPAMKIGLNAVYIPHRHTWNLEHEPVVAGSGKLVILPAFRELRGHF